ncbi:MAG: NHLP bacteriocin system secretion protein [Planctomycetes bacterium]|nr:NHLP bacteriocin system secretion protein [Planctomycetota bacterium]HPY75773.1 NHLP bacteriocin system secretion protein [Planctomycetota bacterium]HQB01297.1 NHLP bacteriocin system secretion protein [Planctomycetota bacterium]
MDQELKLQILRLKNWCILFIFILISFLIFYYCIFGKIPITAKGNALILTPETVKPFQAGISGKISKWHVKVGDIVQTNQLLVEIEQPLEKKELEQMQEKLYDLRIKNQSILEVTKQFIDLELKSLKKKQSVLTERIQFLNTQIKNSKTMLEKTHGSKIQYLEEHAKQLQDMFILHKKRNTELQENLQDVQEMRKNELVSADQVLTVQQNVQQLQEQIAQVQQQMYQAKLDIINARNTYLTTLDSIVTEENSKNDLQLELAELEKQTFQLREQWRTVVLSMDYEEQDILHSIERIETNLKKSFVYSEYTGCILELPVSEGYIISETERIGTIDTRTDQDILQAVVYFSLADGKKIKPGMRIRLNPATADRKRFGSLLATVNTVSIFPVSTELVAKVIGNAGLAETLTANGHQIEIIADLSQNENGYIWDETDGPSIPISAGTMASALINLEEKKPIEFIIPLLSKGMSSYYDSH